MPTTSQTHRGADPEHARLPRSLQGGLRRFHATPQHQALGLRVDGVRTCRLCAGCGSVWGVFYDSCVNKTLLALDNITSLENVVEVKLLPCRYSTVETSRGRVSMRHDRHGSTDRVERGDEEILAIATWTPKGGVVYHREAFEQCMRDRLLGRWSDLAYRRGSWDGTVFPLEAR